MPKKSKTRKRHIIVDTDDEDDMPLSKKRGVRVPKKSKTVSYTHLTLPTICSV